MVAVDRLNFELKNEILGIVGSGIGEKPDGSIYYGLLEPNGSATGGKFSWGAFVSIHVRTQSYKG